MAHDEPSAREKALDFYEIEPALLRVVAVSLDSSKTKPRDHLVPLWRHLHRVAPGLQPGLPDD